MRIAYGFDDPEVNRGLLHDGETMLKAFVEVSLPGRYLVNDIPILRHVPSWFPGAGFKKRFAELAQVSKRMHVDSFERVKKDLASSFFLNSVPDPGIDIQYCHRKMGAEVLIPVWLPIWLTRCPARITLHVPSTTRLPRMFAPWRMQVRFPYEFVDIPRTSL